VSYLRFTRVRAYVKKHIEHHDTEAELRSALNEARRHLAVTERYLDRVIEAGDEVAEAASGACFMDPDDEPDLDQQIELDNAIAHWDQIRGRTPASA
jgi:hypothetical protein